MTRREDILLSEILYDAMTAPARGSTHEDDGEEPPPPDLSPVITSGDAFDYPEEPGGFVFTVTATGGEGPLVYSIEGGADGALFFIDPGTGEVEYHFEPDFEAPTDANTDNVYEVTVGVSDGVNPVVTQDVEVTVTNVAEPPIITSGDSFSYGENDTGPIFTVEATVFESDGPTEFTIESGADALLFSITLHGGVVTFNDPPDFEDPQDDDADNVYELTVGVHDGLNSAVTQAVTVTVTDVSNPPVITSGNAFNFAENGTGVVFQVTSTGGTGTVVYTTEGGADQAKFAIDENTGEVTFVTPPDFEVPTDVGGNNVYELIVGAFDEENELDTMAVTVTVTDVTETTWDPSAIGAGIVLSNGNLTATKAAAVDASAMGTVSRSTGKRYFEMLCVSGTAFAAGIGNASASTTFWAGANTDSWGYVASGDRWHGAGSGTAFGASYTAGDVIGVAVDFDNDDVYFSKNGVFQGSGNPVTGANPTYTNITVAVRPMGTVNASSVTGRFTAASFSTPPPTGYLPWDD